MIFFAKETSIWLRFDKSSSEQLLVIELLGLRFQLKHTPLFAEEPVYLGDVIEAELLPDKTHRFLRIVEAAPMRHHTWSLTRNVASSLQLAALLTKITEASGVWEQVCGGILHVHMPLDSTLDLKGELARIYRSALRDTAPPPPQGVRQTTQSSSFRFD